MGIKFLNLIFLNFKDKCLCKKSNLHSLIFYLSVPVSEKKIGKKNSPDNSAGPYIVFWSKMNASDYSFSP